MKRFLLGVSLGGLLLAGCEGSGTNSSGGGSGTTGTGGVTSTGGATTGGTGTGGTTTGGSGTGGSTSSGGTGGTTGPGGGGTAGSAGGGGSPGCVVDGTVMAPEECDDGNAVDGDGCDNDCTFSCVDASVDCPAPPACQQSACLGDHTCDSLADPSQDGASCGANALCVGGVCTPIVCGDGLTVGTEQCDFGAANGPGAGCEVDCTYSCTMMPDSCSDAETCNEVEACAAVMVGGSAGQKCMPGMQLPDCSACGGGLCGSGVCNASSCGDGCMDPAAGEQCEPPGTATCDAMCKTVVVNPCGNGVRDAGEQCDDGNTVSLDGCDATCNFEEDLRSNYLLMQFGVDAFCGNANKLGSAIAPGLPQTQVQNYINTAVKSGATGFLVKFFDLASLTGMDDPFVQVGVVRGPPVAGPGYDGTADLDWWYTVDAASVDAARDPLDKLSGNILGNVLTAGPGSMTLPIKFFSGATTLLRLASTKLQISVGASLAPTASAGSPPGHLASEHLDPALQSVAVMGDPSPNLSGKLCGDAVLSSLAQSPIPAEVLPGAQIPCAEGYTMANSLLDLFVGGCTVFGTQVLAPTQPDKSDPSAPPAGAGAPYTLSANAQRMVTTCRDKTNTVVTLSTCLSSAAYSSYFRFAMGRVILK